MRLLLAGDIHIGRTSTRLTGDQGGRRPGELGARAAWGRIVDAALHHRCAAVLLSGDVADQENGFWEAVGPLQEGTARLAEAGIRTVAVAGNHDHSVLGRLADALAPEHFTLVGRGGRWERITLERDGVPTLHVDGWSFPGSRVTESPLERYDLPRVQGVPVLGMVHGDLDAPGSVYAPLTSGDLRSRQVDGWLLGHIHVPRLMEATDGGAWILYPGSPQALHPGESGVHGVWLVEVEGGRLGVPRLHPLSTARYEVVEVQVDAIRDPDTVEPHLLSTLEQKVGRLRIESGEVLRHVGLRVAVTGSTDVPEAVARAVMALGSGGTDTDLPMGRLRVRVHRVTDATTPRLDLEEAALSPSALGATARLLLLLEGRREPHAGEVSRLDSLVERTRSRLDDLRRQRVYRALESEPVSEAQAREHLRLATRRLLSELAGQRSHGSSRRGPDAPSPDGPEDTLMDDSTRTPDGRFHEDTVMDDSTRTP